MPRTLTLIRALEVDDVARSLAQNLCAAGAEVIFVCDETRGAVVTAPYEKISLTEARLGALGLAPLPAKWGWLCGDMCYYAAAAAYPDYDRYMLLESDVFIGPQAAQTFVATMEADGAEVIAAQLDRHAAPKRYSRGLESMGLDPHWGCIFPVSRASARAVDHMKTLRLRAIKERPSDKINDEAILAAAAFEYGLSHISLEALLPDMFARSSFDTNPPHLFDAQIAAPDPAKAFHPTVTYATVKARIASGEKNYNRHRLRRVLAEAPRDMRRALKAALEEKGAS